MKIMKKVLCVFCAAALCVLPMTGCSAGSYEAALREIQSIDTDVLLERINEVKKSAAAQAEKDETINVEIPLDKMLYKEALVGSWYREGEEEPQLVLYSDGTCKIAYEYGTGTWDVVNDNVLKLTNFYGETQTGYILSLEDGQLVTGDGEGNNGIMYNTPQL